MHCTSDNRYTCKAVTDEVFEAIKLALVTSVPPPCLPETLTAVIDSQAVGFGHATDDLERVWEESILANAESLVDAAPLPRAVAKRVIGLAYETAVSIAHADEGDTHHYHYHHHQEATDVPLSSGPAPPR